MSSSSNICECLPCPCTEEPASFRNSGLAVYEYIANHIDTIDEELPELVGLIVQTDLTGQCSVSTARYLFAIDGQRFAESIDTLVKAAIAKDRDHVYLAELAATLYGSDYRDHAAELSATDDNFRRMYKRLYPVGL